MTPPVYSLTSAARAAADRIAARLTDPTLNQPEHPWRAQSLADGTAGIALLHIARAHARLGTWATAHAWLAEATRSGIHAAPDAGLYRGVPAVAFAVHTAAIDGSDRYRRAISTLDRCVTTLTHRRIDRAHERIDAGQRPRLAEYDLISGLTGIGAHLLRHTPGDDALQRILEFLVRLSEPLHHDGETLPGWWTEQDPHARISAKFPGGHANLGLAHGITGPLALLAHSYRRAVVVDGQAEAIERICAWLDTWRQDHDRGPWWPQWITRGEHRTGRVGQPGPLRPSWCYGTPGIARTLQVAAIATGDSARQRQAEHAFAACLSDQNQLGYVMDHSLCHGWAGVFQTAWRAAADATTPAIAAHLPHLADLLLRHTPASHTNLGFLEGDAGLALALHTAANAELTNSGWDTCLLLA